ncbi:MAG: aminotransferase class III-fold pyridoxal phosphate-dependent enzyme [Bacteroidota bacterium]
MQLFDVYPLFDLEPVRGEGSYVYDAEGRSYLDFYGGHAVISIGHSHPHYINRISEQLNQLGFYSNSVQNPLQAQLAQKLGQLSGLEAYQLFLCNSGAEANENALKMASFQNGRTKIIAFERAFHGRTSAAVNVTTSEKIKAPINRGFEVEFHKWNDLESVAASLHKGDVCAVIIEGLQGIGGIHLPDAAFLQEVQRLCNATDTVFILDEIQSGFGRTGKFFAFQHLGVEPDIISMAKGMGNGFPIGGILLHPKFEAKYGLLGTTFGGNHLACAACLAVLEVLESENLIENAALRGARIKQALSQMTTPLEVRGEGLMIGVELAGPVKEIRKKLLFEDGVFTGSSSNPNVIRLLPALNIGDQEEQLFLEKFIPQVESIFSVA